jgi:hypothetical protein
VSSGQASTVSVSGLLLPGLEAQFAERKTETNSGLGKAITYTI